MQSVVCLEENLFSRMLDGKLNYLVVSNTFKQQVGDYFIIQKYNFLENRNYLQRVTAKVMYQHFIEGLEWHHKECYIISFEIVHRFNC